MPFSPIEGLGVAVAAISGVIAGRGRGIDLFGACFLGLITCFGGGTLQDLILDVPVVWTRDSTLLGLAVLVSVVTFFTTRLPVGRYRCARSFQRFWLCQGTGTWCFYSHLVDSGNAQWRAGWNLAQYFARSNTTGFSP